MRPPLPSMRRRALRDVLTMRLASPRARPPPAVRVPSAYEVLSDAKKRDLYDQFGEKGKRVVTAKLPLRARARARSVQRAHANGPLRCAASFSRAPLALSHHRHQASLKDLAATRMTFSKTSLAEAACSPAWAGARASAAARTSSTSSRYARPASRRPRRGAGATVHPALTRAPSRHPARSALGQVSLNDMYKGKTSKLALSKQVLCDT